MALSVYTTYDPFEAFFNKVSRALIAPALVKRAVHKSAAPTADAQGQRRPQVVDIYETEAAYELIVDAPGMLPDDIKVELQGDTLTVSGSRPLRRPEGAKLLLGEREAYTFTRSFTLPQDADPEAIAGSLDAGVLRVTVSKRPKPAKSEPKRIAVTAASS